MREEEFEEFPLNDVVDQHILMHREAHFGGNFDIMIDYYEKEGKGCAPEFSLGRIKTLKQMEQQSNSNLAPLFLSGADAERISRSRNAYKRLRSLYENKKHDQKMKHSVLIADLILSEDEEAEEEVKAIVAEKSTIVPALIDLIKNEEYYDVLSPGYGLAPSLAVTCLGLIGDKRAINALFELIGEEDFYSEEMAVHALKLIGTPAKEFLLHVLHAKPVTYDNERAAVALVQFKDDPEVVNACFSLLKELDLKKSELLATHLVLICEGLKDERRQALIDLGKDPKTPTMLRQDIKTISTHWKG